MTSDAGVPGAPRFDVVLRGYDRRQVDEHVDRLQRVLARMRADLEVARSQPLSAAGPSQPARPRPTPRPRPGGPAGNPDTIGNFTDRMESILQSAEEEAAEIRRNAHVAARAETEGVRSQVADLIRQRDAVLAELTRMRTQLEGLLAAPTAQMPAHEPGGSRFDSDRPYGRPESGPRPPEPGLRGPAADPAVRFGGPPATGPAVPTPGPTPSSGAAPQPATAGSGPRGSSAAGSSPGSSSPGSSSPGSSSPGSSSPGSSSQGPVSPTPNPSGPAPAKPASGSARSGASTPSAPDPGRSGSASPGGTDRSSPAPGARAGGTRPSGPAGSSTIQPTGVTPAERRDSGSGTSGPRSGNGTPPSSGSGPADATPARPEREAGKAAHRLPTGAYPAVGDNSSMRPRSEPDPEPADLFRPVPRAASADPQATAVPRSGSGSSAESTTKVGSVRPEEPTVLSPQPGTARTEPGDGRNGTAHPTTPSRSG